MKVHLGTDHAGFEFKEVLKSHLESAGHDVVDHGALEYDALDDYPAFCIAAAQAVVDDQAAGVDAFGVVIGGSGNGEQMAANLVKGARTALAWNPEISKLARQHNNAQIVAVGARQHPEADAIAIVDAFLAEPFSGDERHERRIDLMAKYEEQGPQAL